MILTPQRALHIITDLGDAALLLPASLLMLGYFLYLRSLRGALAWASAVGLCVALTIVAKLGFMACGTWVEILDIRSPSGHTSLSAMFYCGSAVAIASGRPKPIGRLLLAASIVLVLVIAVTRVLLDAHSASEVVLGLAIGGVAVAWFARATAARTLPAMAMAPIAACFIALALALHHMHVTLEGPLEHLAALLRQGTCG